MGGNILLHMETLPPDRIRAMVVVSATMYFPEQARAIMRQVPAAADQPVFANDAAQFVQTSLAFLQKAAWADGSPSTRGRQHAAHAEPLVSDDHNRPGGEFRCTVTNNQKTTTRRLAACDC